MEVSGKLQTPAALARGKNPRYPLDKRLGGPPGDGQRMFNPLHLILYRSDYSWINFLFGGRIDRRPNWGQ